MIRREKNKGPRSQQLSKGFAPTRFVVVDEGCGSYGCIGIVSVTVGLGINTYSFIYMHMHKIEVYILLGNLSNGQFDGNK